MRITRYPHISEPQFFGCVSAFVDSLSGELNAATMSLRRLAGSRKGSAFAYEMTLDTHRYGALIVLDRWSTLVGAFGPHLEIDGARTSSGARPNGYAPRKTSWAAPTCWWMPRRPTARTWWKRA